MIDDDDGFEAPDEHNDYLDGVDAVESPVSEGFGDDPFENEDEGFDDDPFDDDDGHIDFADPGGNSALRAATPENPRNLPCPNCEEPNRLTPADAARGYQCDACADRDERGY